MWPIQNPGEQHQQQPAPCDWEHLPAVAVQVGGLTADVTRLR